MNGDPRQDLSTRIAEYRQRWEAAPGTRAFIPLADALRQAGRCEEALELLQEGLARHPRAIGGLVTLARTFSALGRTTEAADVASRVLEHDADNLVALELLGDEERRRGDLLAALVHFERLAELEPGDTHWAGVLAGLREQRLAAAQAAAEGGADAGFATPTLVELYLAQGYREKAVAMLQRLVAERPGDRVLGDRLRDLAGNAPGGGESGARAALAPVGTEEAAEPHAQRSASVAMTGPAAGDRREQSREQFAMWIERLRAERGVTP